MALHGAHSGDAVADPKLGWFKIDGTQHGLRHLKEQLKGLEPLRPYLPSASILDLGCAEGLIGKYCIDTWGANALTGIESVKERVELARQICAGYEDVKFIVGDADNLEAIRGQLLERYDVVLALAILHKLRDPWKAYRFLAKLCTKALVIRMPDPSPTFRDARSGNKEFDARSLTDHGFKLVAHGPGPRMEWTGIFERVRPSA